jgi:aminoglycoside phosphotransferase (APT) family kinase protein
VSGLDVAAIIAAALPGYEPRAVAVNEDGWDSVVVEVDGLWIVRVARSEEVGRVYRTEQRLLAALAPTLSVAVPDFTRVGPTFCVYRKLPGARLDAHGAGPELGESVGGFLRALHAFPVERAAALGVGEAWEADGVDRLEAAVLPLLAPDERRRGELLVDALHDLRFEPTLVHADLGPEHILCSGGRVTGVLDWSDTGVGDPALDLGWLLLHASQPFADALASVYGVDEELAARAEVYERLFAWHEVAYGLRIGRPEWVESGLAGVRRRLPGPEAATGDADTMVR